MDKYYYLVASLPYLKFDAEVPMSSGSFLEECAKWVPEDEMRVLTGFGDGQDEAVAEGRVFAGEWREFEMTLRRAIVRAKEPGASERTYVPDAAKGVLGAENPLVMEERYERAKWDFLEGKAADGFFSINALAIYYLKLRIKERLAAFNKDEGEKFFYNLCEVKDEQTNG
ncbi:MAG: DUF2764 family protein [Candidatus Omnitrophica bacterium]|nr:DUF2764 family protein [Candidatus Omnitrophota bacterium]MDD5488338.1 DUF2764 family protein [Candidatus Omnitrophota bacterium]